MQRSESLDALRGLAILLMVLSGSIAFGDVLPGWMFHAQVPPPDHVFKPEIPGITWVDLVFPFFLFSMGAAIPLAMRKRVQQQVSGGQVFVQVLTRFVLLAFFAIFTMHARAWVMSESPSAGDYLISAVSFGVLFLIYANFKGLLSPRTEQVMKIVGWALAIAFLLFYPFREPGFSVEKSDIIIIVLANMAFFGTLIWWFTKEKPLWRLALLPFVMAVFLASKEEGSLNAFIFNSSLLPWLYKFYYLKYLFIVLPATFAGEWLLKRTADDKGAGNSRVQDGLAVVVIVLILLINLAGLYGRYLLLNFFASVVLASVLLYLSAKTKASSVRGLSRFIRAGVYLLMLGLFFEAYEGGIKKDFSTYSYYFVCTGLAFLVMAAWTILEDHGLFKGLMTFFAANGKNPMVAYTAGNLLLIPLLKISDADEWLDGLNGNAFEGLLRGLIFTGIVSLITVFFVRKKIFWKT